MELEGQLESFRARGLEVAALSYDSTSILKEFAQRRSIRFPLLSDSDSAVIDRFGLRNGEHPAGDLAHGVPYPGTFVTDASGVVLERFFEATYAERRTAASVLVLAGEAPSAAAEELHTRAFLLRKSQSNPAAAPGQRLTLVLDFEMEAGMHAYAPGVSGYRALHLALDPHPLAAFHDGVYPPSHPFLFAPLNETAPVLEGRFRVTRDVTLAGGRELAEALKAPKPQLEIRGTLEYQACSDRICYPPASLPLRWTIELLPLDRQRSPEAMQHKP